MKLYLEYEQEDIETEGLDDDDLDDFNDFSSLKDSESESYTFFYPFFLYRNPIPDGLEIDVDFDIDGYDTLHLVVVRYKEHEDGVLRGGKWLIHKLFKTRRDALEEKFRIVNNELEIEFPFDSEDPEIEEISISSLNVED